MIVAIILVIFILATLLLVKKMPTLCRVAIVSCMKNPKNVETWLQLHRDLGIVKFYIRLEDTPQLVDYLQAQPDVFLEVGNSTSVDEYVDIMSRQTKIANDALEMCTNDTIDWLILIDCDEILEGDLGELCALPSDVGTFWMQNYEAVYDKIPYENDSCFSSSRFKNCSTDDCASYVNGKGGGRVGVSESAGCHRFKSSLKEVKVNMIVKHYESCDFGQYVSKYKRLANSDVSGIPFQYYRDSIQANGDTNELEKIYKKYRVQ